MPWCSWPVFRRVVAADAVAEGVPAVVADSTPDSWQVGADDLAGIARVGSPLLSSRTGAIYGNS
jgi:hypothetical protein